MKIRNKPAIVFDIEVFKNVFHCTLYNTESEELLKFECSERKNQIHEMCQYFLNTDAYFVGYNNIHYDNPIINYCIDYFNNDHYTYMTITKSIYNMSEVITSKNDNLFDKWKKWKYAKNFLTLDLLTMLYSKALRISLKEMQVTMMYKNVQEFELDWNIPLLSSQIDEMIQYNINDVMSTTELLKRCEKDIQLRINIEDQHNINCLSKDGVGIGVELLKKEYLEKSGKTWDEIKDLRSPADSIKLKDIILPNIQFKDKILVDLLNEMKTLTVSPGRNGWNKKIYYGGLTISVGVGGIHSINTPEIFKSDNTYQIAESDANSLYPSLICAYKFYPLHLDKNIFISIYDRYRRERLEDKKAGRKIEADTKKLLLNSITGMLQNEYSWLYSPYTVLQVRINGQLIILKLCEKLLAKECTLIQVNTDAAAYRFKISDKAIIEQCIKEVETETGLTFATDYFKAFYQLAVNDYFAITDNNNTVERGCFITKVRLGKGLTAKIIPKAVIALFKDNIPIEQTIKNSTEIQDFLMSEKTGKQWNVEYNNTKQQRINRFYASTNGAYLWKYKLDENNEKQYQNMLTASGVTLLNTLDDKPIHERKINYNYYISEANKIVNQLQVKQLSLW